MHDYDSTRRSWNVATRNHNAHKGDQAAFFRAGGDVLFPEELELLGPVGGKTLVHLQCNAGQDSLCLARRGALVTGVDLSDDAIAFATELSAKSGIAASFHAAEVVSWMHETNNRFDVAFASYGALTWIPDLDGWMRGAARILHPGGRLVSVEFHPLVWSFGADLRLGGDDYFEKGPFVEPVCDYVAVSGASLGALTTTPTEKNTIPANSWQHGVGEIVEAVVGAGFALETLREYPFSNGCRVIGGLVAGESRRWEWPTGTARVPLMLGVAATRR